MAATSTFGERRPRRRGHLAHPHVAGANWIASACGTGVPAATVGTVRRLAGSGHGDRDRLPRLEALVEIATASGPDRARASEHALARYELNVQRRLDRTRLLVRAGPAIGLMGTLIPLAPGLAALSAGDVATLAENLRDAFGATVVGLLVGTVAFALTLARTRMYTEDLAALEQGAEVGRVYRLPDGRLIYVRGAGRQLQEGAGAVRP